MDCILTHQYGQHRLYRNLGNTNHWIKFKLVGTASNRDAIGAKVRVLGHHRRPVRLANAGGERRLRDAERHPAELRPGRRHERRPGAHRVAVGQCAGAYKRCPRPDRDRNGAGLYHPGAPDRQPRRKCTAHFITQRHVAVVSRRRAAGGPNQPDLELDQPPDRRWRAVTAW